MNRYLYASLFGATVFGLQLLTAIRPRLRDLATDSMEFVAQALADGLPLKLALALGSYLLVGLFAHIVPLLLASKVHHDLLLRGPHRFRGMLARRGSHTLTLLATLTLMVIANHAVFPVSLAIPNSDLLLIQPASPLLIYGLSIGGGAVFLCWLARVAGTRMRAAFVVLVALTVIAWAPLPTFFDPAMMSRTQPDIIVIGVDSLRPDHLRAFGYTGKVLTPTIDGFVHDSVRFDNAYTPMGRTFVAYMSILSGDYPTRHGARENLYPANLIDKHTSVAQRLKDAGYATVFAMDESRFANFDQGYGFDTLVTPPPGMLDFLLGGFLDTVGTNLLQLLPYSDALMPHVAGNRAAATMYRPSIHDDKLARAIASVDIRKPLFLVTHYCIAHTPYALGQSLTDDGLTPYEAALPIADNQISKVLGELKTADRLNNAVVVLLSDHGEGLGLQDDHWLIKSINDDVSDDVYIGRYFGHGLPAMDESQVHVLLTMQRYRDGQPAWPAAASQDAASLVDVVPTLLSVTGIGFDAGEFDGTALLDPTGAFVSLPERPVFVESGTSGVSLQKANIDPTEVANEFSHLYQLTPDYRLELHPSGLREQLRSKQRAVLFKRYGVSSWPSGAISERSDCWMKLDRATLSAQCMPLDTTDPVVTTYKALLCRHFAVDRKFVADWCSTPDAGQSIGTSAMRGNTEG